MQAEPYLTAIYPRQCLILAVAATTIIWLGLKIFRAPVLLGKVGLIFVFSFLILLLVTRQKFSISDNLIKIDGVPLVDLRYIEKVGYRSAPDWTSDDAIMLILSRERGSPTDGHQLLVGNLNGKSAEEFAGQIRARIAHDNPSAAAQAQ